MVLCLLNEGAATSSVKWKDPGAIWFFQMTVLMMNVTATFDTGFWEWPESPVIQPELLVSPKDLPASLIPSFPPPAFLPSMPVSFDKCWFSWYQDYCGPKWIPWLPFSFSSAAVLWGHTILHFAINKDFWSCTYSLWSMILVCHGAWCLKDVYSKCSLKAKELLCCVRIYILPLDLPFYVWELQREFRASMLYRCPHWVSPIHFSVYQLICPEEKSGPLVPLLDSSAL